MRSDFSLNSVSSKMTLGRNNMRFGLQEKKNQCRRRQLWVKTFEALIIRNSA